MNRYNKMMQRIANGERILIDGATGTEIERRGAAMVEKAWNGGGALTHPDVVRSVHEHYIEVGAEVVISNTFSTSRYVLRDAGMEQHFEFVNRRSVELAIEARENMQTPDVLVAGGMTHTSFTRVFPEPAEMQANLTEQAQIMADAGADLIMLEMMYEDGFIQMAIEAAQATGLPVWAGISCRPNDDGQMCLLRGMPLPDAFAMLKSYDIPLVNIMHTQVEYVDECLAIAAEHWDRPIGVYAHSGEFIAPNWVFDGVISPVDYDSYAERWLQCGVNLIGGCCGIGAEHIELLKKRFI